MQAIDRVGNSTLNVLREIGSMGQLLIRALSLAFKRPFRLRILLEQMEFVGVGSLFIVMLTGFFTGAVFTLQSIDAMQQVGMESLVGSTVMLVVTRELAPVLTALMVAGRVGSSMATELGTMRVTEQIDAMEVMAVDPTKYLISPRLLAGVIMVPALTALFDLIAALGSYGVAVSLLDLNEGSFLARLEWFLDPYDFWHGLAKATVFGLMISLVGCYKGFFATGGARGVGIATTQSVVVSSISIFILDYVLTTILLVFAPPV